MLSDGVELRILYLSVEPPRQESGEVVALRAVPNAYGLTSDGE